jgi:hypothetical protein
MTSGWEDSEVHAQNSDWVHKPYAAKADIGGNVFVPLPSDTADLL